MQLKTRQRLMTFRLVLSGSLLGVTAVGIVGSSLGLPADGFSELVGGAFGAVGVMAFKVGHLI